MVSQTPNIPDSSLSEDKVFEKVEAEAAFPGSETGWRNYLQKNLDPNVPVENGAPVGVYTVIVQFIVDKDGVISDVKALTNFGYGMEQQVILIIQKGPKWTPAIHRGKAVRAYRKQPVTFMVRAEGFEIEMEEKYILYTGIENIIYIHVDKLKRQDIQLRLSQGTVTENEGGSYTISVDTPGKAILSINNKKRGKEIGSVYFVVKKKK